MKEYKTSDIGLASALKLTGYRMSRIDSPDGIHGTFIFEDSMELQASVNGYWDDELRGPLRRMHEEMRALKGRIKKNKD